MNKNGGDKNKQARMKKYSSINPRKELFFGKFDFNQIEDLDINDAIHSLGSLEDSDDELEDVPNSELYSSHTEEFLHKPRDSKSANNNDNHTELAMSGSLSGIQQSKKARKIKERRERAEQLKALRQKSSKRLNIMPKTDDIIRMKRKEKAILQMDNEIEQETEKEKEKELASKEDNANVNNLSKFGIEGISVPIVGQHVKAVSTGTPSTMSPDDDETIYSPGGFKINFNDSGGVYGDKSDRRNRNATTHRFVCFVSICCVLQCFAFWFGVFCIVFFCGIFCMRFGCERKRKKNKK